MHKDTFNVLIVDDSPIIVKRLVEILEELEFITFTGTATHFSEAESLLKVSNYDLALLDINLPGKNGIELLTYIKNNYPQIKIIMLSNQSNDYYRNLCRKLGSDSFIDKSSEFEKIQQVIMGFYDSVETNIY